MASSRCLSLLMRVVRGLQGLPCLFMSRQMILFSLLLCHPMGMGGAVL